MKAHSTDCIAILEKLRWNGVPKCPYCESLKSRRLKDEYRYQCNECYTSYSVTVGTLFHKTRVDLYKWFRAIHLMSRSSESISVRRLAAEVKVNRNTACYMMQRIRQAQTEEAELLRKILTLDRF